MKKYSLFQSLSKSHSIETLNTQSFKRAATPNRSSGWKHQMLLFLFMGVMLGSYAQTTASATWFGATQTNYSPTIVGSLTAPAPTIIGYPQLTQGTVYGTTAIYQLAAGTGNPLIIARSPVAATLYYGEGTTTSENTNFNGITYAGTVQASVSMTDAGTSSSVSMAAGNNDTRYVDFNVSPPSGNNLTINNISMNIKSPVGALQTFVVGYSIDGGAFTKISSATTVSATGTTITGNDVKISTANTTCTLTYTTPVTINNSSTLTVRFIGWRQTSGSAATSDFQISNVVISGSYVSAGVSTPSIQASSVAFGSVTTTGMTVNATRGNGSNVAIFMKDGSGTITNPSNGTAYTANTAFGSGTQLGSSGYYCVYNGNTATTASVAVTNPTAGHTYYVQAFEYNGTGATTNYNTSTATNNPNSQATTAGAAPVINSSLSNLVAYVGSAISTYTISGTNSPTSYVATGLPTGLSVNSGNGQIIGTPSASTSGYYPVTISASNGNTGTATLPIYVLDVPTTTSIAPTSTAVIASGNYSITVNGTNFVNGYSSITVGGSTSGVTTTYVSATQLTATITAATITSTSAIIGVTNSGVATTSNTQTLTITVSTPTITTISPTTSIAGGGAFTLTVNGTNFISGISSIKWGGAARTTNFVSATQLTASILASDVITTGSYAVTVSNTLGGTTNTSGSSNFTVSGTVVNTFNSSTNTDLTWLCPSGVTSVTIEAWGGGGAGGGGNYTSPITCNAGGGGAGGSYVQYTISVTPGNTYYYYVGAGGAGVSAANGSNGNFSYFGTVAVGASTLAQLQAAGSTLLIATGGTGGTVGSGIGNYTSTGNAAGNIFVGGAAGGTSSITGNIPSNGATYNTAGTAGVVSTGGTQSTAGVAGQAGYSGAGGAGAGASGSAGGGAGGNQVNNSGSSTAGSAGTIPGGGGSGGSSSRSSKAGGAGAAGQIKITYGVTPSAQPTNLSFSGTNGAGTTATWSNGVGTGDNTLIVAYPSGSAVTSPTVGITYTANATYGIGSVLGLGYVVYAGSGTSVAITGMSGATTYDLYAYTYNGYNIYLTSSPLTNTFTTANTPVITSALTANGSVGTPFTYSIAASFSPTSYSVTGTLPTGVAQVGTTNVISGTPSTAGAYTVAIAATNGAGAGLSKNLVITILDVPTTTSISPTSTPIINSGNYSVTVNGSNFVNGASSVTVNGSATGVTTTYVSATQLTASITAATIGASNSATIGVSNTGVQTASNTQTLSITAGNPASFTATAHTGSLTQIDLSATADGLSDKIAVVSNTANSFTTPSGDPAAIGVGNTYGGTSTLIYYGPASGLSSTPFIGSAGTTYYFKAFSYDNSFNYSTGTAISASTNHSYLVNTDFTGVSANYFSSTIVNSSTINVAQHYGSGILGNAYVAGASTGYALGTVTAGSSTGVLAIGTNTTIANANSLGMYMDFLISPTTGNSLNVSGISGTVHQSGTATVNTFGVYYGVGTATTPPTTFYNANGTDGLAGTGTSMSSTTMPFNTSNTGGALNGVSNIQGTSVLYVRVIVWRNYAIGTNSGVVYYVSGLTVNGTSSAATAPSAQSSNLVLTGIDATHFSAAWTNNTVDAGSNSLVVMYPHGASHADPVNGTTYTANSTYGSGTAIGNGYVLYNGTGTSIASVAAASSGNYDVDVYAYNTPSQYNSTSPLQSTVEISNIIITAGTPPTGTRGSTYAGYQILSNTPGATYSILSGSLPTGLSLSSSGLISGTPTSTVGTVQTFSPQIQATHASSSAHATFTFTINPITTYYYKGSGAMDSYTNWYSSKNGAGLQATSDVFSVSGNTFVVLNNATTANNSTSSWSIGSGNFLTIGSSSVNGVTLTIDATHAIANTAGTVNIIGANTINIQSATVPLLESTLPTTSTVIYGSTTSTQTIATSSYGNLTISNTFSTGASTAANSTISVVNLTVSTGATLTAITGTNNTYISLSGAAIINGNYVFPTGSTKNYITGAGSFTVNSGAIITIGDAAGIAATTSAGNIRTTVASRSLTAGSYVYNASGTAVTGAGLSGCKNLTINNASGTTTISASFSVTGLLSVNAGTLACGADLLTLKSTSITNTATVAQVLGSISGTATVERFIPSGLRVFRDLGAGGVAPTTSIFANWQESGINNNGYGTQITGAVGTNGSFNSTSGFDYSLYGSPSLFTYKSSGWDSLTYANGGGTKGITLDPFQGYRILIRGNRTNNLAVSQALTMTSSATLRSTGKLIYGDVTFNVGNVSSTNGYTSSYGLISGAGSYTLISNPYASVVDWNTIVGQSNMNGSYWYNDPTFTTGSFGTFVGYTHFVAYNNSTGIDNIFSQTNVGRYLQPGQAIFVQNPVSGTPKVKFTELSKASQTNTAIFGNTTALNRIALGLFKNGTNLDGTVSVFNNSFSSAIGNEDAIKFPNSTENVTFKVNGKDLAINGYSLPTASDILSVHLSNLVINTPYSLKLDASQFTSNGLQAFLQDNVSNTKTLLVGSNNTIFFTTTSVDVASYANRYSIVFGAGILPLANIKLMAFPQASNVQVSWTIVGESNFVNYTVQHSVDCEVFTNISTIASRKIDYMVTDNKAVVGNNYYRIKATNIDGTVSYSNVATVTIGKSVASIAAYPNPLFGSKLNIALNNLEAGKYNLAVYNVLGAKVIEKSITHVGGTNVEQLSINSHWAAGSYSIRVSNTDGVSYQSQIEVK